MSSRDEIYTEIGISYPYNEYGGRRISIVDLNLISGSSDLFRQSVGGYFFNDYDEYGQILVPPKFVPMQPATNINPMIHSITSFAGESINESIFDYETGISTDDEDDEDDLERDDGYYAREQNTILPFVKFVCHIEGDSSKAILSNPSTGNKYWEAMFTDKNFDNQPVPKIYDNSVYDEHYTSINLPYDNFQKSLFSDGASVRSNSKISYDYNLYNKSYQQKINSFNSEKEQPNCYILNLLSDSYSEDDMTYKQQKIIDYYAGDIDTSYFRNIAYTPPPDEDDADVILAGAKAATDALNNITDGMLRRSSLLKQEIESQQTNLIFNSQSTRRLLATNSTVNKVISKYLPFYTKIEFNKEKGKRFCTSISENNYSTFFMKTLKEVFLNQTEELRTEQLQFLTNERFLSASVDTKYDIGQSKSEVVAYRGVDFTQLLLYSHNKIKNETNDFTVIDDTNLEVKSAKDEIGSYRAFNVRNVLRTINDTISNFCKDSNAFYISDINSLINLQNETVDGGVGAANITDPSPKYNEVVAYRIEKIGGTVSGDSNTQSTIQNFWIFNDTSLEELSVIDSQVKYGTDYTYKIYAYYLIQGLKYEFSDLQLTRIVGTVREAGEFSSDTDVPTGPEASGIGEDSAIQGYCVEYYNPNTGDVVKDLLGDTVGDLDLGVVSSTAFEDTLRIRNSSLSSDIPVPPYFANFVVTAQPSLKLIEVPIQTKQLTITDHIPNKVNVNPSYALDNSNKLIFNLNYQTFQKEPYPRIVNSADNNFKNKYLISNDISIIADLQKESVSPARYIDIYRIAKKPKTFLDFEQGYIATIDNRIEDKNYAYKTAVFHDIVKSNVKYYYLFKTRNDLNIAGQNSQIIEAELVNDGGFKYALFDVFNEEQMIVKNFKRISDTIKKIIEVTPNVNQIIFDDSGVDYTKTALSEYDKLKVGKADELIWNKTFKLRLTSKKTGKKIDLNITYNDPSVNLENN